MAKNSASIIAWIAIILSIIALGLGWSAYNRTGADLGDQALAELREAQADTAQELDELQAQTQVGVARLTAHSRLLALEAEIEAEEEYADIAEDVAGIRTDLRNAYTAAEREAGAEFEELDADLESLEESLRAESTEAKRYFQRALERLQEDRRGEGE